MFLVFLCVHDSSNCIENIILLTIVYIEFFAM